MDEMSRRPGLADRHSNRLATRIDLIGDHDRGAAAGKHLRRGLADAARRAGHDRLLSGESKGLLQHVCHSIPSCSWPVSILRAVRWARAAPWWRPDEAFPRRSRAACRRSRYPSCAYPERDPWHNQPMVCVARQHQSWSRPGATTISLSSSALCHLRERMLQERLPWPANCREQAGVRPARAILRKSESRWIPARESLHYAPGRRRTGSNAGSTLRALSTALALAGDPAAPRVQLSVRPSAHAWRGTP